MAGAVRFLDAGLTSTQGFQSGGTPQGVTPLGVTPFKRGPFTGGDPLKETLMNFFARKMVDFRKLQLIGHSPPPFF